MDNALTAGEEAVMRRTFIQSLRRAADIIERITAADVLELQARLLETGRYTLDQVSRVDRAMVAASHLRACAKNAEAKGGAL